MARLSEYLLSNTNAVLLRVCDHTNLVDGANISSSDLHAHEAVELRYPYAPALHIYLLPTRGFDVGVGDVASAHAPLSGNFTACHGKGSGR